MATELATTHAAPASGGMLNPYGSIDAFAAAQRIAQSLAASTLIPQEYRSSVANCLVALELASRLGASPLMVMQSTHIIHGRPFLSASFVAACINACGRFKPLRFRLEGEGDERSCTAWAEEIDGGGVVEGPTVSMAMAHAEGWIAKKGSKWQTMPDLMLRYRAITFFGRIYASDILMGMHTAEEASDMNMIDVSPDAGVVARMPARVVQGAAQELPPKVGENGDPSQEKADARYAGTG